MTFGEIVHLVINEQNLFIFFSTVAILSALGVVLNLSNTVYAALSLVVSMLALAGLFVMLNAEFVGVLQVMIYAGAIVVLFLFVVMLLNLRGGEMAADRQPFLKLVGAGIVIAATVKLTSLLGAARSNPSGIQKDWMPVGPEFGSVRDIGLVLYTDYLLLFQVSGILLLAGIVAAVILAKQKVD